MMSSAMRQLEERHMASKVEFMVWSNKMDLLALSNCKGEVSLHRLSWQRVWTLAPPEESVTVVGIAWRPDGQVIAIAYSNSVVLLVDVENKEIIHKTDYNKTIDPVILSSNYPVELDDIEFAISSIDWVEENASLTGNSKNNLIQERTNIFLPRLPPISRSFGSINEDSNEILEDTKKIIGQKELNFLVVGLTSGLLHISAFGLFHCGVISLPEEIKRNSIPVNIEITSDLKYIFVLVCTNLEHLQLVTYDSYILNSYCKEIYALAYKHGQILSLMDYLENTMNAIREAYENMLLLDAETKLAQYAEGMPEGTVSADFLELLMFGVMSDHLETFLLQDLTDKGIKKLGHSIELSHSNIQKLILKHVQAVCQSITYHLSELKGMARFTERFEVLGIDEATVSTCFTEVGSFLVKANELLLVIDECIKKYKALLKWLYELVVRISEDRVQTEINVVGITEQETKFIADYLYMLEGKNPSVMRKHCFLDHVGQYIANEELTEPFLKNKNHWGTFLKDNPCISHSPIIVPYMENLSLTQQYNRLKSIVKDSFSSPQKAIGSKISLVSVVNLMAFSLPPKVSMIHVMEKEKLILACTPHRDVTSFVYVDVLYQEGRIQKANIFFKSLDVEVGYKVIDLQIYSKDIISVLLQNSNENRTNMFVQTPLRKIQELMNNQENSIDAISLVEPGALRTIENMTVCRLAVSGTRRVAVLLSENMHKVRTYEMEVEEEEEEEDMDTTRESDSSSLH